MKPNISWHSEDNVYMVKLSPDALEQLLEYCRENSSQETGGILVGKYDDNYLTAHISKVLGPPPDSRHDLSTFERGVEGLANILSMFWKRKERQYYLGEWHYHPHANPVPSQRDINTLREIAQDSSYSCSSPVLIILGGDPNGKWKISAFVSRKGKNFHQLDRKHPNVTCVGLTIKKP